uniref:NADH dehydrogenase subunit 2 n=1 Tax=Gunungiella acanthoclada TaxID=3025504 RepID=UPI002436134B|nr:NADH dehydrogenase subunit 2 [Gunungiella acanthoclada]WEU80050.1 NADH dehydrogenase subunit 2 [Gunungiella acanthoclada]
MMNLNKIMFLLLLLFSSMYTISTNSWISCWMGLEINLFSFIPLIHSTSKFNSESMMKYFIIQVISSSMFLISIIFLSLNFINLFWSYLIMNLSLFMKMGSAPFHLWYVQIIEGLKWNNCFMLFTWQKLAPMILLTYNYFFTILILIILLNSFFGAIKSVNQTSLRKILTFSSINHMSWMLMILMLNEIIWLTYFSLYALILISLIITFNSMNLVSLNQIYMLKNNFLISLIILINMLSLGGLPPFLGFYIKWISIYYASLNNFLFITILMLFSSLIILYTYMRISYFSLTLLNFKTKWFNSFLANNLSNKFLYFFLFFSMFFLNVSSLLYF